MNYFLMRRNYLHTWRDNLGGKVSNEIKVNETANRLIYLNKNCCSQIEYVDQFAILRVNRG